MNGRWLPRLGKSPATPPRVRPMREVLRWRRSSVILEPVPTSLDRGSDVTNWPLLDNDTIGDCTVAAVGHAAQLWTAAAGDPRVMTDAEAISGYEAFGYRPGDPATDQGANAQDVLTRWTGPGFRIGGVRDLLAGFCQIPVSDEFGAREGVAWLGVVYAGVALPLAVQGAGIWDVGGSVALTGDYAPGSWGGHAVPIIGYGPSGLLCVTWGKTLWMTWPFWRAYADEAYGLLSRDFARNTVPDETWAELEVEMAQLRSGVA